MLTTAHSTSSDAPPAPMGDARVSWRGLLAGGAVPPDVSARLDALERALPLATVAACAAWSLPYAVLRDWLGAAEWRGLLPRDLLEPTLTALDGALYGRARGLPA